VKTLFVAPQVPVPPVTGGTQRTYHLLKGVAGVGAVTFVTATPGGRPTPETDVIRDLGCQVELFPQESLAWARMQARSPLVRRISTASKYLHPVASASVGATASRVASALIADLCRRDSYDLVWVERLSAFPLVPELPGRVVFDFHDVEHVRLARKLRTTPRGWKSLGESLEYVKLRRYELARARAPREVAVCSAGEAALFPGAGRVWIIPNGVSVSTDLPALMRSDHTEPTLLFVGTMSYPPNVDAAAFFCRDVLPLIRRQVPDVRVLLVGHEPPAEIRRFHDGTTVIVTGSVPSVQPYLAEASVAIVPLRFGGGTRIKILEALAHGRPVVSTTVGAEGLDLEDGKHLLLGDAPERFAEQCVRLLRDRELRRTLIHAGWTRVKRDYDWPSIERLVGDVALAGARMSPNPTPVGAAR